MPRIGMPFLALFLAAAPVLAQEPNPNIRFGMPAQAKADPEASPEAFLISRPQYVLSYNAQTRTPNWVCWCLRQQDIGTAARSAFEPDPGLPRGIIARVTAHDYDGSGFDRGHMCPPKDRSASAEDSQAVFYTTNIVPQSPASNQIGRSGQRPGKGLQEDANGRRCLFLQAAKLPLSASLDLALLAALAPRRFALPTSPIRGYTGHASLLAWNKRVGEIPSIPPRRLVFV